MRFLSLVVRSALVLVLAVSPAFATTVTIPVTMPGGGAADVAVHVVSNPLANSQSEDVLIVHGLAQNGATFVPLANALVSEGMGNKVGDVLIVDLPGHGQSTLTAGVFGFLTLEDYADAVSDVLDALPSLGYEPTTLVGHSMGGAIVQLMQETLLAGGSSLRAAYGVTGVSLLAPVILPPNHWPFVESGVAATILSGYIVGDPVLGPIVSFPAPDWVFLFYSNRVGAVVAGAPSNPVPFMAPEALFAGAQVVRAGLLPIPFVREGAFAAGNGTVAGVATFEQDSFFAFPNDHQALYVSLTGDAGLKFFTPVVGPTAVHNMHTFDPNALTHSIKKVMNAAN